MSGRYNVRITFQVVDNEGREVDGREQRLNCPKEGVAMVQNVLHGAIEEMMKFRDSHEAGKKKR